MVTLCDNFERRCLQKKAILILTFSPLVTVTLTLDHRRERHKVVLMTSHCGQTVVRSVTDLYHFTFSFDNALYKWG